MRIRRILGGLVLGLLLSCIIAVGALTWSNRDLPTGSREVDHLAPAEKNRVGEFLQLKMIRGEMVWKGWARADIPVVLYNETNTFLLNDSNPPLGWTAVEGDEFFGRPYYWQPLAKRQAFALRVGDR